VTYLVVYCLFGIIYQALHNNENSGWGKATSD